MKVVLVDDELMALENLKYVIGHFRDIEVVGAFTDPLEAIQKICQLKPDAVFLDIEMPQINGFTVAEEISEMLPETRIVFVTGFDDYAVKAFDINAIDYVLKPASKRRLGQTIDKLVKNRGNHSKDAQTEESRKAISTLSGKQTNKIIAWKENKIFLLRPEQILCFSAKGGEVVAVTKFGQFKVRNTLNCWEERLSESGFFRCHRAFLINLDKIEVIRPMFNNIYDIKLVDYPDNIPVSRKYAKQLKQILGL
ncbi:MAG TPA: response regulator [Clostridiaceae bacterium]|nr:response regulator [Clostridiaceae bacterium]